MKKILIVAGFFWGITHLSAQQIGLATENVELGNVAVGSKTNAVMVIKNEGSKPLIIQKVQPSCGCTVPSFPTEPIAPGKTGEIKIQYAAGNVEGDFSKTVTIYSNDEKSPRKIFRVKGKTVK
ncbi:MULTISPECIES: DUF1573 domain-containing protein [Weeksella]|uniref:DUF1573 domain-containing protein n=1 Tax=Weeksella TaxID=1013 RepID=UPI0008A20166|nr:MULTISPECIES: DUF1573 domain-containing protein [Weeksella]MDK7375237.1 DUF1573 domain-containing protein [Weeksella virosa]OFM85728.1 hypothetical protein HMPREF2660_06700 [Weeksella sp. HMSC059D05]